jgi:DNA topoisomerase-2
LTNVFSKQFVVEIGDMHSTKGKCKTYKQVWEDNMHVCHEAEIHIDNKSSGEDFDEYTKISFVPDLARLTGDPSVTIIPDEEYKLMRRRVIDIAGCSGGKLLVTLNGEEVSCSDFQEYVDLYRKPQLNPMLYHKINARWELAVGLSETKSFESISFVNGMNTSRGGTHVDELARQISHHIANHINTKMAKQLDHFQNQATLNVTPRMVRRHLFLCVNSLVENPSFDSQMKECLTSNPITFGSDYTIPQSFLRKLVRPAVITYESDDESDGRDSEQDTSIKEGGPGIVEEVLRAAIGNQQVNMARLLREVGGGKQTKRQVVSIPKLEDANLAGTAKGAECTLILTEGDSAKALAVAGLEVISRDKYGVFPLRGKFLNVRNVSVDKLAKNAELKAICTILGLQFDKAYHTLEDRNQLRYGHVMLMTDQDADGSHIKGLIMNLFRHFWPELLKPPVGKGGNANRPFMSMFVTPLLKATKKGKGKNQTSISFFSMSEYNAWRESLEDDEIRNWSVKYYKGLGTSTSAEAKEYFLAFIQHHRPFRWQSGDGERIDMAFEKEKADERKDWILTKYDEKSSLTVNEDDGNSVTYGDFVDCELIHFSNANNIRSLPNVVDGLKPSQRKVLYACFKRNLKDEIKV